MDKLQIQKAHLVGLSLGGFIVIDAMATCPKEFFPAWPKRYSVSSSRPGTADGRTGKAETIRRNRAIASKDVDVFGANG
jgi:pimeloyl-ACP methyl ester carboxylesterase